MPKSIKQSFPVLYKKLVKVLKDLRDQHDMDPERIASQACATLNKKR